MHIFVFLLVVMFPFTAAATSPCVPQTAEEFKALKEVSDLIATVKILDYQAAEGTEAWTKAQVIKVYKGEAAAEQLHIHGWASYEMPLYTYDKGAEVVLLLKKTDAGYELSDITWKSCVPSVIGLPAAFPIQWMGKAYTREEFIDARLNPPQPEDYLSE